MGAVSLSLAAVRRIALHCQGLDGSWSLTGDREGAAAVIERLGYVQIDTIHVIRRAHHHILWTRYPDYHPEMLHGLLAEDRRVFEWWTHAASYIPMSDFRFYAPRMGERALSPGQKAWRDENRAVLDAVVLRIREEGALGTSDFDAPEGHEGSSWWSGWKPAKRALEVLFNMGVVTVSERRKFQRIYDLRDRVIPEGIDHPEPDAAAVQDFVIRRSLGSLGALPESQIRWWRGIRATERSLQRGVASGTVTPVDVEGMNGEPWYAWTAALNAADRGGSGPPRLRILSPFDNLIIHRAWMEQVLGYRYRVECYVPREKRRYGYFALPILYGDRFIGRVDTKADRKPRTLIVRQLTFEPDFDEYDRVLPLLAEKLRAFGAFNGCHRFTVEHVSPDRVKDPLSTALES
jgi:uncharacterized protein YcaQ